MDGRAFIFVPLLAATWIFGLAFFSYLSHVFLTIVEETGNGTDQPIILEYRSFRSYMNDGFNWSEDPFSDWALKLVYVAYITGVWIGPSVLIGRAASDDPWWRMVFMAIPFWLGFPLSIASSLLSPSRWNPCWPPLVRLLFHRPVATFAFYLFSLPMIAVIGTTVNLLLIQTSKTPFIWVFALAPIATIAFFLYARLLGRWSFVLNCVQSELYQEPIPKAEPKARKRKVPVPVTPDHTTEWSRPKEEHDQHPVNAQPEDLPPIMTPDQGEVTGYNLNLSGAPAHEAEPKPRVTVHVFDGEEDASPIPVNAEDDRFEPTVGRIAIRREMAQPSEREIALYTRNRPKEPDNPYGVDLVVRMLNSRTIAVGIALMMSLVVFSSLQRALNALRVE